QQIAGRQADRVAGDKDEAVFQVRPVLLEPSEQFEPVDRSRHPYVGNDQVNLPVLEELYSFLARGDSEGVNPHGSEKRRLKIYDSGLIVDHERSAANAHGSGLFRLLTGAAGQFVGCIRKGNGESRAFLPISCGDLAVVFFDYSVAHTQSQTGSPADLFCGKEGLEYALRRRQSGTIIQDFELYSVGHSLGPDEDSSGAVGVADGVVRVVDQVEQHLLNRVLIGAKLGISGVEFADEPDISGPEFIFTQLQNLLRKVIGPDVLKLGRGLACKLKQVSNNLAAAVCLRIKVIH